MAGLLRCRDYRHLLVAQVSGLFGTGLATVALALLSYDLAGARAGSVLATAFTIKMVVYVTLAPVAAALVDRLPRRTVLIVLEIVRAATALVLPFADRPWHVYALIAVLQSASAAFTPTYQAVLPDVLPDEAEYTQALSFSSLASTLESLVSPLIAAALLTIMSFHWLFACTAIGFVGSAALVWATRIPQPAATARRGIWDRTAAGIRVFAHTPRLRGVMGINIAVAAVGAVVMVNSVNVVRDALGGSEAHVPILLAANGFGVISAALVLPRVLDRVSDRTVMVSGAAVLVAALGALVVVELSPSHLLTWRVAMIVWAAIGVGMGVSLTPIGRVLRRSSGPADRPAVFAAQFSLSHLCWLAAYPISGWVATTHGFGTEWSLLLAIAAVGLGAAVVLWPSDDRASIEHLHDRTVDAAHVRDAQLVDGGYRHSHDYVVDDLHHRWPTAFG